MLVIFVQVTGECLSKRLRPAAPSGLHLPHLFFALDLLDPLCLCQLVQALTLCPGKPFIWLFVSFGFLEQVGWFSSRPTHSMRRWKKQK